MRVRGIHCLLGLDRVGQIDVAEFDPIGHCSSWRRLPEARHTRALRQCRFDDDTAECPRGPGHDNDFSVHDGAPGQRD